MQKDIDIKICGLTSVKDISVLKKHLVRWAGFVFYPNSPRNLELEVAKKIISLVPNNIEPVAVTSDPKNEELLLIKSVNITTLQLHGEESPERCQNIMDFSGLKIIKAFKISESVDLNKVEEYTDVCDYFLFDGKPPKTANRPGGNAVSFDWGMLAGRTFSKDYILSGGLNDKNVSLAIRTSGCKAVDVSSGVESSPGKKDLNLIRKFCISARN